MPISEIDGIGPGHWIDVLSVLTEAIEDAGFNTELVSDSNDVQMVHKTIVQNLYDNPIVVCDVSGKNPNVMFELGLRLAFDKPTVIVKDDHTAYSFDTSVIEHLNYPRDLRYRKIIEFKKKLAAKVKATYDRAAGDPTYTTFLKNFGEFTVAKIDQTEVTAQQAILDELRDLRHQLTRATTPPPTNHGGGARLMRKLDRVELSRLFPVISSHYADFNALLEDLAGLPEVSAVYSTMPDPVSHASVIRVRFASHAEIDVAIKAVRKLLKIRSASPT